MSISDVVNVSISVSGAGPQQAGFGEPLIAAYHTHYTDRVREYGSLSAMVSDGFLVTEPAYLSASKVFAQNPAPPFLKIGRRALPMTQVIVLTALSTNAADVYTFTIVGSDGVSHAISVPSTGVPATDAGTIAGLFATNGSPVVQVGAGPAVTMTGTSTVNATIVITITTGGAVGTSQFQWTLNGVVQQTGQLTAATFALPGTGLTANFAAGTYVVNTTYTTTAIINCGTVTHPGSTATFTQVAGKLSDFQKWNVNLLSLADTTADPGLATDLAAILAADSNWYGLLLDSNSALEITAAAAWAESNGPRLFIWNNSDTNDLSASSTTDIFYTEKQLAHARSAGIFSGSQVLSFSGAAWMGRLFPTTPGSENWAFKTLSGVLVDNLTDTQLHAVENKNGTVYTVIFGLSLTQFGKQPSGQFIDITRGTDALTNQIQVAILALLANNLKVPFTDAGIDMVRGAIQGVLTDFVSGAFKGFLSANPTPVVNVPAVNSLSSTNKAARNIPNVTFTATLAGAINSLTITGTLTQ